MNMTKFISLVTVIFALTACAQSYKLEIQQGNVITGQQLGKLQQGMSPREVRYLLGTPLIIDPFHKNRWDYFYSKHQGSTQLEKQKRVTIIFDNERLIRLEGDTVPGIKGLNPGLGNLSDEDIVSGKIHTTPTQKKPGLIKRAMNKIRRKE